MTHCRDLSHPSGSLIVGWDLSLILRCSISSSPYKSSVDDLLSSPLGLLSCIHIGRRARNAQNWARTSSYIATVTSNVDFYAYFRCCRDSLVQTRHDGRAGGGIWSSVNHSRDVGWFQLNRSWEHLQMTSSWRAWSGVKYNEYTAWTLLYAGCTDSRSWQCTCTDCSV